MSYDEDEEVGGGFKMNADEDEPLDMMEAIPDDLEMDGDEDPDKDR